MGDARRETRSVLVAGAGGALGRAVARRLAARGDRVIATWRTEQPEALAPLREAGCETRRLDLSDLAAAADALASVDAAVLAPILTVSGPAARAALCSAAAPRLVLFSSNNVAIDFDSPTYAALRAEEALLARRPGAATVIRPTMIYGYPGDESLSALLLRARRWPLLPIPGSGEARQQPIHVDDLAALAIHLLDAPPPERTIAAGGPDVVSLKALCEAAARAVGRRPGVVVPLPPLAAAARLAARLGLPLPLAADQLARIDRDKTPLGPAPRDWRPKVGLEEGLARLASELGLSPSA
jgi:nucleoside-diphosphate-sugar epimerase